MCQVLCISYPSWENSAKIAEVKVKEEYKKYKSLHLGDVFKVEKDYIKALEDMKIKLLGEGKEKAGYMIEIMRSCTIHI